MLKQHYDSIIIGAGISGISAAYHLQKHCPDKTYTILERRERTGGTWDLFNYPGIRSDSDMYTFGFSFKPWNDQSAIAKKSKILDYLDETANEYGIDENIEFQRHIKSASWSSESGQWTIRALDTKLNTELEYTTESIFMCVGYYNYDNPHAPSFEGSESFSGDIIHPQFWPEGFDYKDKNVVVVGSGATAITLVPSMADEAKHITMLQRSPTYIASKPAVDPVGNTIAKWLGRRATRWWFILNSMFIYAYCKAFPSKAKSAIIGDIEEILGDKFDATHFTPSYDPWDQRFCLCPDGDFFNSMKAGKASIVTDKIKQFTPTGVELQSGNNIDADVIVTATGLEMLYLGGIEIQIDGKKHDAGKSFVYKGLMISDVPNMFMCTGYTNASWTLKVDLTNRYACRLLNYMSENGLRYCIPQVQGDMEGAPLLDLQAGYIQRKADEFPKQGKQTPWKMYQNYIYDKLTLRFTSLQDSAISFFK